MWPDKRTGRSCTEKVGPGAGSSQTRSLEPLDLNMCFCFNQWPFQEPKLEVPTIYKAYGRPM